MRTLLKLLLLLSFSTSVFSQGRDKVTELVSAENYFAALAKEKGIKKAFLKVSDAKTIVFKPGPISAIEFYKNHPEDSGLLSWEPVYARISKSGDWGFTTGPFKYSDTTSSTGTFYGDYLSIWKRNSKGVWKLHLDLGVSHKKPTSKPSLNFTNPANEIFLHQRSKSRLQQREDIVFSSDKLLSTIQKADNKIARNEFLAEESRLLFPGFEPILGKNKIISFWQKQGFKETSTPVKADRAYSGELAMTYGDAIISKKGKSAKYHYVRIWEVQPGYKWNIILEIYTEAGKEPE